jgi:hypothetical protein
MILLVVTHMMAEPMMTMAKMLNITKFAIFLLLCLGIKLADSQFGSTVNKVRQ